MSRPGQLSGFTSCQRELRENRTTCEAIVRSCLDQIYKRSHLNIFIETFEKEALKRAAAIDEKRHTGKAGKLAGMVVGLKDNIAYKDHYLTASSQILSNFKSLYNATVTERLLNEDAIIIGRVNCDEFAMGSSNERSIYGPVKNPFDESRVPGGSSGGSAAAVAAGMCHAALGSDTGGSIRQPASYCHVVGLKPTYGLVSRYGLVAYASSFDQVGPLTNNVDDAALLLEVITGPDGQDSTLRHQKPDQYSTFDSSGRKIRIARFKENISHEALHPEIKSRVDEIIRMLKDNGHQVEVVEFPYTDQLLGVYHILTTAEASSNLARYDGLRYGKRFSDSSNLNEMITENRTKGFGREVKRKIMMGNLVLSGEQQNKFFSKANKVRSLIRDHLSGLFGTYDFILSPTTPTPAFGLGEIQGPVEMYLQDIYCLPANIGGLPAISLPLGMTNDGLPFGIQMMADHFMEKQMFGFSKYLMGRFGDGS